MSSGVSAENVVATIDVPSSHHGMFRSAATNDLSPGRSPRRLSEKATVRQKQTYRTTIAPSQNVSLNIHSFPHAHNPPSVRIVIPRYSEGSGSVHATEIP